MTYDIAQSARAPMTPAPAAPHEERLARARRRMEQIKGFYIHLAVFVLVLVGLTAVDFATGDTWWVHWVFLGWGIGVAAHGLAVLGGGSRAIARWEERKVRELMERD
jgi:fatty acid desaturase